MNWRKLPCSINGWNLRQKKEHWVSSIPVKDRQVKYERREILRVVCQIRKIIRDIDCLSGQSERTIHLFCHWPIKIEVHCTQKKKRNYKLYMEEMRNIPVFLNVLDTWMSVRLGEQEIPVVNSHIFMSVCNKIQTSCSHGQLIIGENLSITKRIWLHKM